MPQALNLFEFVKYSWDSSSEFAGISDKGKFSDDLEIILDKIWSDRKRFIPSESLYYSSSSNKQRFVDFSKNGIAPRNWLGSIHLRSQDEEYVVNLLPKVFHKENHAYSSQDTDSIFAHILWWLSGSDKQNYSSMESSVGALKSDLLEILVWIFSINALEVLSNSAYNYYEEISEEVQTVKGHIDFDKYIYNYGSGKRHELHCVFDSFQYDNLFNRIVKYVSTLLKDFTKNPQTKRNLEEILFILDEVEYASVTVEDCDRVVLNSIYTDYRTILDSCKLFLSSLSVFKWKDDFNLFALLIPSEKLFENFIFTTLKNNLASPIKSISRSRPGRTYLAKQLPSKVANRFSMINDIVVELQDGAFILCDTKYKKVNDTRIEGLEDIDPVYNISQADIYQMVSYAVGSGISDIGLIYPHLPFSPQSTKLPVYEVEDELSAGKAIRIHPVKVNIVHSDGLGLELNGKLTDIFKPTNDSLINELMEAIIGIKTFANSEA